MPGFAIDDCNDASGNTVEDGCDFDGKYLHLVWNKRERGLWFFYGYVGLFYPAAVHLKSPAAVREHSLFNFNQ